MGNSSIDQRNLYDILFCIISSFGNCVSNFVRLPESNTNISISITDNNDSIKTKTTTTLHNFRYAIDVNKFVLQIKITCFNSSQDKTSQ